MLVEFVSVAATGIVIGMVAKAKRRWANEKLNPPVKEPLPTIVPWASFKNGYNCPKCNLSWFYDNGCGPAYCECKVITGGHFHLTCTGTRKNEKGYEIADSGCKARFLMKAKDSYNDSE